MVARHLVADLPGHPGASHRLVGGLDGGAIHELDRRHTAALEVPQAQLEGRRGPHSLRLRQAVTLEQGAAFVCLSCQEEAAPDPETSEGQPGGEPEPTPAS